MYSQGCTEVCVVISWPAVLATGHSVREDGVSPERGWGLWWVTQLGSREDLSLCKACGECHALQRGGKAAEEC